MGYSSMGGQSFTIISDMRKQKGTPGAIAQVNGLVTENDGMGGSYFWNDSSIATDEGYNVIKVDNVTTGRWIRLRSANYSAGRQALSGALLTTSYDVTHGLGVVPSAIFIQPVSANAAQLSYISAKDSNKFTITFITVPVIGTLNLVIDWLALR